MRRAIFFVNPLLAVARKRRAMLERGLARLCDDHGRIELCETRSGTRAGELARTAVEAGFDTVFACGGDGTLFHVLQGVAGSNAALGVIPWGTGNVLAQNLRLPRDPVAALLAQWYAEAISIPLGQALCTDQEGREQSWYFTIAAGMGFHAALMGLDPRGAAKRILGRAAYYGGGIRLLATRPVQPFSVEFEDSHGDCHQFRAAELLAVRVPEINRWHAGGNLCSSWLRVASVAETGRGGLAHASMHALFGRDSAAEKSISGLPYARYHEATRIVCKTDELPVQADGEIVGKGNAEFRMAEKRVRLLWPGFNQ